MYKLNGVIRMIFIDTDLLKHIQGNTYYLEKNDIYLILNTEKTEVNKAWYVTYDDFGEQEKRNVRLKDINRILIDKGIAFE